jgi:hypothetical protein
MKVSSALSALVLLGLSTAASAVPMEISGPADSLVAWGNLANSGEATEREFLADYLNVDASAVSYTQFANSGGEDGAWEAVNGTSALWAYDFGDDTPALFLIKTGNHVTLAGGTTVYDTFLFSNTTGLSWGVIDLGVFGRNRGSIEIAMVSHVGATIATTTDVPEPGTLALLGLGLMGLGVARRKRA